MSERPSRAVVDRIGVAEGVLESTRNGVLILDLEHRIVARNSSLLSICGVTAEALDTRGPIAIEERLSTLVLDPLPLLPDAETRARIEPSARIHTLRFKDGRHYERFVADWSLNGSPVGIVVVFNDVTRLARAEEALARDREFLEKAQEVAHIGSWTVELSGDRKLEWSPEMYRILGVPAATVASPAQALAEMVHPDDRELVKRVRDKAREAGEPYSIEHRILRPDGRMRWVQTRADVVQSDGRPARVIGTMQDITERYALEEQLRHAQRLEGLGRLAGGVAHDLNNALNVITGYTEVLLEESAGHPEMTNDLEEIRRATERAAATVRQLLTFSRKQPASRRRFNVDESIVTLKSMIERLFGPEIAISVETEGNLPPISGDPGQIEQALFNLSTNAKDAMPEGGRLTFRVYQATVDDALAARHQELTPGHFIVVEVADTGHGMPPEMLSRIFDPFFTTKEIGQGTGLGLSMVYGTVKQVGGGISVESQPEVGTTFRLYFPIAANGAGESPAPLEPPEPGTTVLVVDDEPAAMQLTSATLTRSGYRVLSATSGAAAIEIASVEPRLDVLLTDLRMPGLHGRDLARAIQARHPDVRLVFMSGFVNDLSDRFADAHRLQKPFTQLALQQVVQRAATRRERTVD